MTRPLTVGSICTGYGGLERALDMAGVPHTLEWVSEIAEPASQVLTERFPTVPNIGDINNAEPTEVDLITAGFPCFAAGTIITTKRGLIPIEQVEINDEVLTHQGRWRAVTSTMKRDGASTREIRATGVPNTVTTDEHPYYASVQGQVWNNDRRNYDRTFSAPDWVDAKDLTTKHRLAQILPPVDKTISGDKHFWRLVGLYLADGWRVRRLKTGAGHPANNLGRVVICANYNEQNEVREVIELAGFNFTEDPNRTTLKFHIVNKDFYRFLNQFGHKAHGKTIPGWVLGLDPNRAEAMLQGYLQGDGSSRPSGDGATTVSRSLALGIAAIAHRARNVVAGVSPTSVKSQAVIEGRTVNQRPSYDIRIYGKSKKNFIDKDGIGWRLVTKNEPTGRRETVYNISVEEDESYVADGAIVHNCQDISTAGRRAGLGGERSGLWWRIADVIGDLRPRFVLLENVAAISSLGGTAVVGSLTGLGYDCRWVTVRASDVGGCHQRARWFCLAATADTISGGRYGWPRTEGRGPRRRAVAAGLGEDLLGYNGQTNVTLTDAAMRQPERFGKYADAIERHAEMIGRAAPDPTSDGRLNPVFVEWMMGLPEGWVTDIVTNRAAALRTLGNGVVPQQAAAALQVLTS